ncbi:phosphomannomutase/phosphoglucomutase [Methylophaga sp. OBS4]|uniref:phosphomannomutase/phosphoglucomutase n=1 Tax=Methylophaga sp. OBS4 TaxID=2991935 RepID=UPI002256CACD|nr:phosphomannomutase/phosphoglucomutase [Methylophaga sp. OBS4]MCX4187657.1 phosphomannomutase/phosphoglucomutase [Methylophaga sp. OBS4]
MKLARKIGQKSISFILLLITVALLLSLLSAYHGYYLAKQAEQKSQYQQQTLQTMAVTVETRVADWQNQLQQLASLPDTQQLVALNDPDRINQWQDRYSAALPEVSKLCLLIGDISAPTDLGCLPITFATLNSLRQLKDNKQADAAMIQPGSDAAHILLVHKVETSASQQPAALLMAIKPERVDSLIDDKFVAHGYAELTQGTSNQAVLTQLGNPEYKQGAAPMIQPVSGSHWQLHYWPKPEGVADIGLLMVVIAVLLAVVWRLNQHWFSKIVSMDADSLRQQLTDLQRQNLEKNYPIVLTQLRPVRDTIQQLAFPKKAVKAASVVSMPEPEVTAEESLPLSPDSELIVDQALAEASQKSMNQSAVMTLPDEEIFKAYDIRGIVGQQLNAEVMQQLGQAMGSEAVDQGQTKLVVGRDGRLSSDSLTQAFVKGVASAGCDVIDIGCVPTPMVYFACEYLQTNTGAVITGSHNPADYNGLKMVIAGKTLAGKAVHRLYERIKDRRLKTGHGQVSQQDITADYIEHLKSDITIRRSMNVVVDCGNGVAGSVVPELLRALGCQVTELFCEVDGNFPNHHPNPGQPENMQDLIKAVQSHEAELGLAFDGDGDRLGVVDAEGNIIWPDRLLILLAQDVLAREPGATIIYDVKSTNLLEEIISRAGGQPIMSPSGHSVIKNKMIEVDAKLAGEMSGHLFFRDRWYGFDDALYSAARLLEFLAADPLERTPTQVFAALPRRVTTPEIIVDMPVGESHRFIEQLQANIEFIGGQISTVDGVRVDYPNGWGLVRASNTVPGLTLRFEASSKEEMEQIKQAFIQQMLQIKPTLSLLF